MKDFLGREVSPGEYFAYPLTSGRSAMMALYQYVSDDGTNVKAHKVEDSYSHDSWRNDNKYKKWVYDGVTGQGMYINMSDAERAKVDGKVSRLGFFSARACKTEYTPVDNK
jgi:hypothetical protein